MIREVFLTETAEAQMASATEWYAQEHPDLAAKWFNGLIRAIDSVAKNPEQFALARESEKFPVQIRQMPYGSGKRTTHRILFVIRETRIVIHQVRHVAQSDITEL